MFKNCILTLTLIVIVTCQDLDEFDEQVLQQLEEQNNAKAVIEGLSNADHQKFDGKISFVTFFLRW